MERRPRSRCQERYAVTRLLASRRWRGSAACTTGQSPTSSARQQEHRLGGRGRGAGQPVGRAEHASGRRVEEPVRTLDAALHAVVEGRRVARDRQRAQEVGVEDLLGRVLASGHRAEAADEQEELLDRGLLLLGDEPLGGLEHHGAGGVAVVVEAEPRVERVERLGLGDHVEAAPLRELEVDVGEGLEARAPARRRTPHALGHRAHPPVLTRQQGDDAVGLTQLVGAQHDRLVAVEGHGSILPHRTHPQDGCDVSVSGRAWCRPRARPSSRARSPSPRR